MAESNNKMTDSVDSGAQQTAHAAAKATAHMIKGATKAGKAVAHVATGTAAGGPAGTLIALAWDAKEIIAKVLVVCFLGISVIFAPLEGLPRAVTATNMGLDGSMPRQTLLEAYGDYMEVIDNAIQLAHERALDSVKRKIELASLTQGIDYQMSIDAIEDYASTTASYDVPLILATYSASLDNDERVNLYDFMSRLDEHLDEFFSISTETLTDTVTVPVEYPIYEAKTVYGVLTEPETIYIYPSGSTTPVPVYSTDAQPKRLTVYERTGSTYSDVPITQQQYVTMDYYTIQKSGGKIVGYDRHTAYTPSGQSITYSPTEETVKYLHCTIGTFNSSVLTEMFDVDRDAPYKSSSVTVGKAIDSMASNLRKTLYLTTTSASNGVSLTDQELIDYINALDCNDTRKYILRTAFALIGKVSYFWGGKSEAGWNDFWGEPRTVTAAGSTTTGTTRPFGLDCSGFTKWVFDTAFGFYIGDGTSGQWQLCQELTAAELQPGDLAFLPNSSGAWNHVLIFAGWQDGKMMFVHCSSGENGVVLNSPSYVGSLRFGRPTTVDYNAEVPEISAVVSESVERHAASIEMYADQYEMSEYVPLIKAVMMQESGGKGGDPMQCSACGYNATGSTITDPDYSISCGIQYLRDCLQAAGCVGPADIPNIKLALQGYNFGGGYITWALDNYGGYTEANAKEFSEKQKEKYGYSNYGDVDYVAHVLRYYSS